MIDKDDLKLRRHLQRFIKARREELGMSQADLSRATGDSDVQISRAERGQHTISGTFAVRLARALNCTTDELLGYELQTVQN